MSISLDSAAMERPIRAAPCSGTRAVLAASTKSSPAAAGLPTLKAILAVHRTVASRLKWNRRLLTAARADHACILRCAALVSTAATATRLLVLLGLPACLAALGRRVSAVSEKFLILRRKCESLPAIAANKLLISSHGVPFVRASSVCCV